jgi:hypothetical protein
VTDIFQEVEEDVRKERAEKFFKQYAKYIAVAVGLLVLVAAGVSYWLDHRRTQAQVAGARFQSAVVLAAENKESDAAVAFATLAEQSGAGYAVLARLREAAARAKAGDTPGALALYDKLATDSATPTLLRDLAAISAALHVLDKGNPADAEKRAEPMTGAANPFRYSAREILALAPLKAGDEEKARERLTQLASDEGAPAGMRRRAGDLLATLGRKPAADSKG